MKAQGLTEC